MKKNYLQAHSDGSGSIHPL